MGTLFYCTFTMNKDIRQKRKAIRDKIVKMSYNYDYVTPKEAVTDAEYKMIEEIRSRITVLIANWEKNSNELWRK